MSGNGYPQWTAQQQQAAQQQQLYSNYQLQQAQQLQQQAGAAGGGAAAGQTAARIGMPGAAPNAQMQYLNPAQLQARGLHPGMLQGGAGAMPGQAQAGARPGMPGAYAGYAAYPQGYTAGMGMAGQAVARPQMPGQAMARPQIPAGYGAMPQRGRGEYDDDRHGRGRAPGVAAKPTKRKAPKKPVPRRKAKESEDDFDSEESDEAAEGEDEEYVPSTNVAPRASGRPVRSTRGKMKRHEDYHYGEVQAEEEEDQE